MKRKKPNPSWILLCTLAALSWCDAGWSANNPYRGKSAEIFSQGQAVYNPQDLARSQDEAVRDFHLQAVTQAVGTYLSPSQMGSQFGPLHEKVLKQPERYIETYQIFSESPMGGLYRVTGQATVSMDALRKDLLRAGFALAEGAPSPSLPPSARPRVETPDTSDSQDKQDASEVEDASDVEDSSDTSDSSDAEDASDTPDTPDNSEAYKIAGTWETREESPPAAAKQHQQEVLLAKSARETAVSRQKHLWAVAERWDREWYLPKDRRDPHGLFALTMLQESQDYGWSLVFPDSDGAESIMDSRGRISRDEALAAAEAMGAEKIVIGTADLVPRGSHDASFAVNLRVLDVASGKSLGEIHKEMDLDGASDQQGAMDMASALVPQLDRFLREPSRLKERVKSERIERIEQSDRPEQSEQSEQPTQSAQSAQPAQPTESLKGAGEWTLLIRSDHQYAYWEDLAKILLEHFKSMRVRSIEFSGSEAKIRIDGVDGEFLSSLQGTAVREGVRIQIDGLSQETHSLRVTFTRSEAPETEPAQ
jgi:hypothetical protein